MDISFRKNIQVSYKLIFSNIKRYERYIYHQKLLLSPPLSPSLSNHLVLDLYKKFRTRLCDPINIWWVLKKSISSV